ncbi:MAG: AAA family ATPase [Chitinivibrionales bacterium]|nr:AAA family ATPase [Chitinivibrionales bacterium]
MPDTTTARQLDANQLDIQVDGNGQFATTTDLTPLEDIVGQPRALRALELGLGIDDSGYNIYAAGANGLGKRTMLQKVLSEKATQRPTPPDWIYVNNFEQQDRPIAIELKAGEAKVLKRKIRELIENLSENLPKAFQQEDFSNEKKRLNQHYQGQARELIEKLEKAAGDMHMTVQRSPDGSIMLLPEKEGRPMKSEEFNDLSEEEKKEIEKRQQELSGTAGKLFGKKREIEHKLSEEIRQVERNFASQLFEPLINDIAERFDSDKLRRWLGDMKEHMLDNLQQFQNQDQQSNQLAMLMGGAQQQTNSFDTYDVNIVVDNSEVVHAPLVSEISPNYKNLFGTIHGISDRMGRMITSFQHIKSGSILRANGGYLMFNLVEALMEPLVWKELKRTIKSKTLEYHMYDPFGVFATSSIRPEPIPIKLKIIAYGNPLVYYLLQLYDEDFRDIFKVKADFASETDLDDASLETVGRFISKMQGDDRSVLPFDSQGVGELLRVGIRMAGDKNKLSTAFKRIGDMAREASYWAGKENADNVGLKHVRKAIDEQVYRSNLIEEKMREMVANKMLLISTEGTAVGQINGLSVIQLGDYMFGRPSRLTASVGIGSGGIVNIERESKLSGKTYDKAMLILEGYLRNTYAIEHPLSLSASIAMEQSYGMIEGDSASVAELLCLLSACAGIPLRQDIAVTGSVNQWGQVQAIGGVNEKIEGFFDLCKINGLSGSQGVCIPASNTRNLVLRPDVIEAVRKGDFYVWSAETVDQATELFTNTAAGSIREENSFHWQVDQKFKHILELLKEKKALPGGSEALVYERDKPQAPPDPRPPLPGEYLAK